MYRYKKLMVCLNLDEHDHRLIKYAGFISRMAKSEEVLFVYVSDSFDIPDEIKKIYPQLGSPPKEMVEKQMGDNVGELFNGDGTTKTSFKAMEGSILGRLISCTKDHEIDLLILGHHPNDRALINSLPEKLARKAFCSVLVIPSNTRVFFDKILVAVDFSEHALNALDVGSAFAKAGGLDELHTLNIYRVPTGHHRTGKTYGEFSEIMLKNSKSNLEKMLSGVDLKSIKVRPHFENTRNVVEGIQRISDELGASLLVVGARGRSGSMSAILLGSVTEGLIRHLKQPLIAVKEKGEGLNILEALTSE